VRTIFVSLEVPPAAHALLLAAALTEGFASVEDSIRDHLLREHFFKECRAFAEAVSDEADPTLNNIFQQPKQETLTK
jgi:hypothetical protein